MINALRAELFLIRKRRAGHVVGALLVACEALTFLFIFLIARSALSHAADPADHEAVTKAGIVRSFASLSSFPQLSATGFAVEAASFFLVLGALLGGSDWKWGTWKIRLTQGPSRLQVLGAKTLAAAIASAAIAVIAQLVGLLASFVGSRLLHLDMNIQVGALAGSFGVAMLVAVSACLTGFGLAIALKSQAIALAIVLSWVLGIEGIVTLIFLGIKPLRFLQNILFKHATGSLSTAIPGPSDSLQTFLSTLTFVTPGTALSIPIATLVLVAYMAIPVGIGAVLLKNRDIA